MSHAKIQFSPHHFHTVLFEDVIVGDRLGVYRGDDGMLQLVTVERVEAGPAVGAYVVLLEDGGSPIVEDALMSMSSMVQLPGPVDETACKQADVRCHFDVLLNEGLCCALQMQSEWTWTSTLPPFWRRSLRPGMALAACWTTLAA